MKNIRIFGFILFLFLISVCNAKAENKVLIIAGAGGTAEFDSLFFQQALELQQLLITNYGYGSEDITVFVADSPDSARQQFPQSTALNVQNYFKSATSELTAQDDFFCFLIGHGSYDNEWGKFNLPGNDLRDFDYSRLLDGIHVNKILFINMASASGTFIDKISKKDRIVITATRNGFEKNATEFANQFLETLRNSKSSDLNKDGQLSATELFVATRDRVVKYYDVNKQLRPEHPLIEDDGDGFGTEMPDLQEGDGIIAGEIYIAQRKSTQKKIDSSSMQPVTASDMKRENILARIKALKKKKTVMNEDDYYDELENLMVKLAKLSQQK
ncbi:MAG: hypothetical protein DWQ10_00025 [Calditrichaeota bacterium]|nr:MAG: hypothetical protein DWQ10_00025 [Calditrichota bacterium]